jgi:Ser/Thr protein kinase RdoA (MazF antagonist)
MPADSSTHPYSSLTPDVVLNAIEAQGLRCDGRLLALNSYENRVYQVGIEEAAGSGRAGGRGQVLPARTMD